MKLDLYRYVLGIIVLIPTLVGLTRLSRIHKSYFWFLLYLVLSCLNETISPFIYKLEIVNVIQNAHAALAMFALLMTLFQWGYLENDKVLKNCLAFIFIMVPIVDAIFQNEHQYQIPWALLMTGFAWMLMAVNLLNKKENASSTFKFIRSKKLILVPLMISLLYFILLNILMAYLFNDHTEQLFRKMYQVVIYLDVFSYICFSIALLWAPKKQQYL